MIPKSPIDQRPLIDLWANFLMNEKLTPQRVPNPMTLVRLCEALAAKQGPRVRPYAERVKCRRLVCETAMDLGIDLAGMYHHGKLAMARSLLDVWNVVYAERYSTIRGTSGEKEDRRRKVKTRLSRKNQ